ncbi:glycosyltransferase [Alistipes sp. kh20]|uniref:glycosyltransferase n=1 Tax=Alistipes montrealensis TaxID=2834113 RepID=UPI001BD1AC98|nr:glycosyltransferase [Alistipes montrealensis]MBS4766695.1 glycosyltransferase [Alistipes montrealensis]
MKAVRELAEMKNDDSMMPITPHIKKIIVNTISTKKYAGGTFQIAYNFMLKTLENPDVEWYYFVSKDLDDILGDKFKDLLGQHYFSFPTQPDFKHSYMMVKKKLRELEKKIQADLVYSISAPSYFKFKAIEVMRFTNPWVTHPNKYSWSTLSLKNKICYYLYGLNQRRMMKAVHHFITQTETCKAGIMRVTGVPEKNVKVVNNVLPAIFKTIDKTPYPVDSNWIDVACIGNATPHKNFDIIPEVLKELKNLGMDNVRFHTTIPVSTLLFTIKKKIEKEELAANWVNHGRVSQKELAEVYKHCQFCFLPTLLEVFSASTVEAMFFNLPIVATHFEFNTEVLANSCLYYEPKKAKDAAMQIAKLVGNKTLQEDLKSKMQKRLEVYSNYDTHFKTIKQFLIQVIDNNFRSDN